MRKNLFRLLICFFVVILFFLGYWFKCQMHIDLVKDFHFSSFSSSFADLNADKDIVLADEYKGNLLFDNFETSKSLENWSKLWMREESKVIQGFASNSKDGSRCLMINANSEKDWSYQQSKMIKVNGGDVFSYDGNIKVEGENINANFSLVFYDREKNVLKWSYAKEVINNSNSWVDISRRFMVTQDGYMRFRITGSGKGNVFVDNIVLRKKGGNIVPNKLNQIVVLENSMLLFKFNLQLGEFSVFDKRNSKEWYSEIGKDIFVSALNKQDENEINFKIVNAETMQDFNVSLFLSKELPEVDFVIEHSAADKFDKLEFPPALVLKEDMFVVLPINEGILIPVLSLNRVMLDSLRYGGGWPMSFVGGIDKNGSGWMELLETPEDFEIIWALISNKELLLKNRWLAQRGLFGYKRMLKFCFFDSGGYVNMAKYYREYIKRVGLFLTLYEKEKKRNIHLHKLIGAANVWYWGKNKLQFANDMRNNGMLKVLFSHTDDLDINQINSLGFLTSKYDNYQDVWPQEYGDVSRLHDGWPKDLVLDNKGDWIHGWVIKKEGKEYQGGVICSIPGFERLKREIPLDLGNNHYTARFIDTTTSSPWRECYNKNHITSRKNDIKYKMEMLKFCSSDMHLITGSEDGVDVAVPTCDYFEGMMSVGIGRLPESGRNVASVKYLTPTESFLKYQVGVQYRTPLWELVYHDCMVTTWYWGDSSNRIPELWWKKDLFNILYGNMPLWAIRDYDHWKQYKLRFIESYNNVCPVFEKVGFLEMLSHRFVTDDKMVQETQFKGDIRIFINFNEISCFDLKELNYIIPAKGFVVFEKGKVWKEGKCS
ncbi:MAG: glycoside hydrolase [Candidatus Omnitrophota bacterium]|jgi:hypothetical protein